MDRRRAGDGTGPLRSVAVTCLLLTCLLGTLAGLITPPPPALTSNQATAIEAQLRAHQWQAADPVRIVIPAINVDAPLTALELDRDGVLPPPEGNHMAGWWRQGPEPGERGPAVIAGHVDSYQGPAVFFRLYDLRPGDRILVHRADQTVVTFVAQRLERHAKNAFPTEAVYGDTPDEQLRLITCGGSFDQRARRYLDNVIVYARRDV